MVVLVLANASISLAETSRRRRRDSRDWSVAATQETCETENC